MDDAHRLLFERVMQQGCRYSGQAERCGFDRSARRVYKAPPHCPDPQEELVSRATKALYLPLSLGTSVAGGVAASAVFNRIWKHLDDREQPPPDPKDLNRSAGAALFAAALQGLVFGFVRAAVDRASARSYHAVTHESPM